MKTVFTNLFILMLTVSMSAQITVEREDYTREFTTVVGLLVAENDEDIVLPEAGENRLWDYTNLNFPDTNFTTFIPLGEAYPPEVPGTNNIFKTQRTITTFPGLFFDRTSYRVLDEQGLRELAEGHKGGVYPIGAVTGVSTDVINFMEVLSIYEEPKRLLQFPMNYGDTIVSNYTHTEQMTITAANFGLSQVPASIAFQRTYTTIINGWGTLRLTNPLDGQAMDFEVLLMKEEEVEVDSIFLNGAPAPSVLLNLFGAVQGQEDIIDLQYEFWTKGGLSSQLLRIRVLNDSSYVAVVNADAANLISSTKKIADELIPVTLSPNPSRGNFQINFTKEDASDWTFEMYNFLGQQLYSQRITGGQGTINETIVLDSPTAGTHIYVLKNSAGVVVGSGKVLVQ